MRKHTPGPWKYTEDVFGCLIEAPVAPDSLSGYILARTEDPSNAARIIECVNACEGIENPAAIRALIFAAKSVMMARLPALNFDLSGHPDMAALDEALHLLGVK